MPTTVITDDMFANDAVSVIDMLVASKLAPSKGEARRLIQQGGISVSDVKVTAFDATVSKDDLANGVIVKKGKKIYHKFTL